jgi:phosphoribosylformylglycinamidine synthase
MKPKVLVIRTAGTNCDKETKFAFEISGAEAYLYHLNYVKNKKNLLEFQVICIPGGFSYGDDLGAGKIFSLELLLWFKESIMKFIDRGGLILGICNGFQVLVKTGILPDLDFTQKVTLTFNDSGRFEDRWVYLRLQNSKIWFKDLPQIITLPVAHAEGRFFCNEGILDKIEKEKQVALRYVNKNGDPDSYPFNPNGSLNAIAGITDKSGRILGLMPHPERFIFKHQYPFWKEDDVFPWGRKIFENAIAYFK